MNGSRDQILARIDEALRAPIRHGHKGGTADRSRAREGEIRAWLPQVSDLPAERLALFARQCHVLATDFRQCTNEADAAGALGTIARDNEWKKIAVHRGSLIDRVVAQLPPALGILHVEANYDKNAMEACDAGITECESLVAQTGSVCVSARSSGGRALSVLPPHHIVLARGAQLVADLSEAIDRLSTAHPGGVPSFISFISGPSRTGDIERILVLGAHGPRKLTILLLP
jgi:L-lactate dehydrogenase complex protein LldG